MPQMLICYFKVARRIQTQAPLWPRDFRDDMKAIIDADKFVERYRRQWRFSQPMDHKGYILGKLGFIASGKETRPYYDEVKHDFIQQTVDTPLTNFSLYAVDLFNQVIAFETKPPDIKYQSFRGAFEKFLLEAPSVGLEIEDFVETSKFMAWANDVERITLFKATLRPPNPNWSKHPKRIQDYLETTNADGAKIELSKSKGSKDGLQTTDTIIEDAVTYGENGFSDILARGEKGQRAMTFNSRRSSPSDQLDIGKTMTDDAKWKSIVDLLTKFVTRRSLK